MSRQLSIWKYLDVNRETTIIGRAGMIMEEKQLSDRTQQDKQINRKINKIINFCEAL